MLMQITSSIATVVLLFSLIACSGSETISNEGITKEDKLTQIKQANKIRIGIRSNAQPFAFSNLNGQNVGFDRKDIMIQIWHEDLDRQVILVPDLEAYPLINPRIKPGINRELVLEGWTLESSFFEYKFREYDTNFGFANGFAKENLPDLYFTITMKREFIDPLISKLVGLICVVSLLFAMLVILDEERSMEVLGVAAGLIFIVIVDQISLRESIAAKGLIYFDYFYFIIYLFISFVGVNALLLLKKNLNLPFLSSEETLPAQLLYWPSLLGILLFLTLLTFY